MSEAVAERSYKSPQVEVDLASLAPLFGELGLGVPTAVTELVGGGARSFRIDRADGPPLVLKAFNDAFPYATGKEIYASQLLRDLDVPMTRFLASDESRTRFPFRYTIANYLPGRQVMTFKDEPDVADLYRQMGGMLRKLHTVAVPGGYGASKAWPTRRRPIASISTGALPTASAGSATSEAARRWRSGWKQSF